MLPEAGERSGRRARVDLQPASAFRDLGSSGVGGKRESQPRGKPAVIHINGRHKWPRPTSFSSMHPYLGPLQNSPCWLLTRMTVAPCVRACAL